MTVDAEKVAPYAPLANVVGLIRRRRDKGMPEVLNAERLAQMGITEGNISRNLQALRFLNLIDEEGRQTASFNRLALAKENEYPGVLAEIIKGAYHDVFTIIDDLNEATDVELNDAFRFYQPQSQRNRMIILFRGLCQEAGLISGGPPETRKRARTAIHSKPSPSILNGARKTQPKSEYSVHPVTYQDPFAVPSQPMLYQEFALLQGLLNKLP